MGTPQQTLWSSFFMDAQAFNIQCGGRILRERTSMAIPPVAIAGAVAFAIEQPADVDVNEIVIRPTAQV